MRTLVAVALAALILSSCQSVDREISVMTFNVRLSPSDDFDGDNSWVNRRDAVVRMISEVRPDIFGIQEGAPSQTDYLDQHLPDYGRYGGDREDAVDRGEANAVFYRQDRFDLVEAQTFWLGETPDTVSLGWDGAYKRTVSWVHLKEKGTGLDVFHFNTHFDHVGTIARNESGKMIVEAVKAIVPEGSMVFLTGDFNANFDDPILLPVREYFGVSREDAPQSDMGNTFNNWGEISYDGDRSVIDHIFYKNSTAVRNAVLREYWGVPFLSDHYPVVSTFRY